MHACPLRSLELKNFKSIADGAVEFKPLTVLVGMNSSGKSSLLQAIRFLSQTAQAHEVGIEVPLNGTKVRLGTFDDARTVGAQGPISLQAGFESTEQSEDSSDAKTQSRLILQLAEPDTRPDRGHAQILVNQLKVSDAAMLFCATHWLRAVWEKYVQGYWDGYRTGEVEYELQQREEFLDALRDTVGSDAYDPAARSFVRPGIRDIRTAAATITMPRTYGEMLEYARTATSGVEEGDSNLVLPFLREIMGFDPLQHDFDLDGLASTFGDIVKRHLDPPNEDDAHRLRQDFYRQRASRSQQEFDLKADMLPHETSVTLDQADVKPLVEQIQDRARDRDNYEDGYALGLSIAEAGELRFDDTSSSDPYSAMPVVDHLRIARLFLQECKEDAWLHDPVLNEQANHAIAGALRSEVAELLQDRVRYLGPLRQEPLSHFDFGDDSRPDVGAAGEHLSQVLQWHSTESVDVPGLGQADLADGLRYWLRELELVEDVAVEARGRAGVSIEVRPTDLDRQVDLTSVGVGVSQVLPVLTVCLLAEPGDIVLLEQPELHLHPALQMRLADFLLACVDSGRQIIVETHSEHLVNRLRRRVAEDDSNEVGQLVRIVFTERDAEGHTVFRPSDINPLGGLSEDWPDGFLDLGARDAQKLLQAGLAKHRRLSDN